MKREEKEIKVEEKVEAKKPKKEFKIEIVKVGKLEENTAAVCYGCGDQ